MERMLRVNELLKRELSSIIEREFGRDLANGLVTVTAVETAPDLRHAQVHISVYGRDLAHKGRVLDKLRVRHGHIQHELMRHVTLKYTPVLHFRLDETLDKADKVIQLLDKLAPAAPPPSAEGDQE